MGSKQKCNNFIENLDPSVYGKSFVKNVQFMFAFIKSVVSEQVLNASSDPDRSDILVFLTIIAVLTGDTRSIIKEIPELFRKDPVEFYKNYGYKWLSSIYAQVLDVRQSKAAMLYYQMLRSKGSLDSIKIAIALNFFDNDSNNLSAIKINEHYSSDTQKVMVTSPYTSKDGYDTEQGFIPYPDWESRKNAYISLVYKALEYVRPAGIYFAYPLAGFELNYSDLTNEVVQTGTMVVRVQASLMKNYTDWDEVKDLDDSSTYSDQIYGTGYSLLDSEFLRDTQGNALTFKEWQPDVMMMGAIYSLGIEVK